MADDDKTAPADEPVHLDVTGQPGGPHPDEQARVDEEQRVLMAERKRIRDEAEKIERQNHEAKVERRAVAQRKQIALEETVADLVKRMTALEAKEA